MVQQIENMAGRTPASAMHRYTADAFAHDSGYVGGALMAVGLTCWIIHERHKLEFEKRVAQLNNGNKPLTPMPALQRFAFA
jgi:hypothetical protein